MSRTRLIRLAACLAIATGSAHASTELLVNGSFEAEVMPENDAIFLPNLTGWTGGPDAIELRNNLVGTAYDGHNFVELDTYTNSSMSQTVNTEAGLKYTLSFAYSPRQNVPVASNGIDVYWNGELVGSYWAKGGPDGNVWSVEVLELYGQAGESTLTFAAVGTPDGQGASLDAVSLTSPVPEPESYAMLLLGMGMLGAIARRKANSKA
jgi:hypothetical protein